MSDIINIIEKGRQNEEKKLSLLEEILRKLEAAPNDTEDIKEIVKQIQNLGRETLELYDGLFDNFNKLKESNAETEEKLAQMREALDKFCDSMESGDYNVNKKLCEQRYAAVWHKLDESSQSFLITASFLCRKCKGENLDFSPMIVEMSRAYENELLEKIFRDFVNRNALSVILPQPARKDALFDAVCDAKNGKPFFISLTQMIKIINRMPRNAQNTYGGQLYNDLDPDWDTSKLSDNGFYRNGITYANDYRNRAAHPGTTLNKTDANDCEQLSEALLNHFIGAMKS